MKRDEFDILFKSILPQLRDMARSVVASYPNRDFEAEDLVNKAYVNIVASGSFLRLAESERVPSYFYTCIRHEHRAFMRRRIRERTCIDCIERTANRQAASDDDNCIDRLSLRRDVLEALVDELTRDEINIVYLRIYRGTVLRDIANQLGVSVTTIQDRLALALLKLARRLGAYQQTGK